MKQSAGEKALQQFLKAEKIEGWLAEYRFHPERRWRFDFAWPELKFAVEIQGGIWKKGGHTTGRGITQDLEKYDEALRMGWNVYCCTTEMAKSGRAIETIKIFLGGCHEG